MKWSIENASGFAPRRLLKICLIVALLLAVLMASISDDNRHPDEFWHFAAARYYTNHFLPPEIGDSAVRDSYSVFGVSYLNYHWAEYFAAGKFALLISPVVTNPYLAARFFNIFLFLYLVILFLYRARNDNRALIIPCFLLVTPQIWYVFSYVNNDGFALFVSLLAADQIARRKSCLNEFLRARAFSAKLAGGIFFGSLVGLLLIAKSNYFAFLIFAALWLLSKFPLSFNLLKKYAFVSLVACLILTFRCGLDFYVNGETNFVGFSYANKYFGNLESRGKLLTYQEEVAEYAFKPSTLETDLTHSPPDLMLKAKGVPFKDVFKHWRWHEISFKSFVGVYGYMTIFAPPLFYQLMGSIYLAFGLYLIAAILRSKRRRSIVQLSIFGLGFFLTAFISAYLSWTYAFQAQGRYLFPVIPMLGLLVYANRRFLNDFVVHAFIIAAFLLSVYSFVFVALSRINAA